MYPFAVRTFDNLTKFELTPEMQEELKELVEKVRAFAPPLRSRYRGPPLTAVAGIHRKSEESTRPTRL